MQCEQRFDPIDCARALAREREQLAVQLPAVFIVDARDVHHTPHAALAGRISPELREERRGIESVGLRLARPAIRVDTRGVHHHVVHRARGERPMHPKPIAPRFVATRHRRGVREREAYLRRLYFPIERREVTGRDRANTRRFGTAADGEAKLPRAIAEVECEQ